MSKYTTFVVIIFLSLMLSGCATTKKMDYSEFKTYMPSSILVLPPINHSLEVDASSAVYAQSLLPLCESGYYVFAPSLVMQTFKNNGLDLADEIQALPLQKLYDIFGADAALYMSIDEYGSSYRVISSDIIVRLSAKLIDLKSGTLLWEGKSSATSAENKAQNSNIIAILVGAIIDQILNTISDDSYRYAGVATIRLLGATNNNGSMLYGPRSKHFATTIK